MASFKSDLQHEQLLQLDMMTKCCDYEKKLLNFVIKINIRLQSVQKSRHRHGDNNADTTTHVTQQNKTGLS